MTNLHVCALSHTGRVRAENQDVFLVNTMVEQRLLELKIAEQGLYFTRYGLLCAVADGMGGHRGGSIASQQVLQALALEFPRLEELEDAQRVAEHLQHHFLNSHRQLVTRGAKEPELAGMGTTLLGVYLRPDFGFCFHAGDSRLYSFRAGTLMQLTSDHSLEVIAGARFDAVGQDIKSGVITNCLGGGAAECRPEIKKLSLRAGDTLLLCSDGLSDMLDLESMEAIFAQQADLPATARQLVNAANTAGGLDNITVLLIKREVLIDG